MKTNRLLKPIILVVTLVLFNACGTATDSGNGNAGITGTDNKTGTDNGTGTSNYNYIPTGDQLTDRMAVKFLDMATMGSTPAMVKDLRQKGVVAWIDDQLSKEWNFKKESIVYNMMYDALKTRPYNYCKTRYDLPIPQNDAQTDALIDKFLANDDVVFNRGLIHGGDELDYHSSEIFRGQIEDDAQLRQRVAYALSQVIVVSESTDFFFKNRGEALSYYYDILLKGAFGKYGDILYDVSLSPAMATYLTYANNRKAYTDNKTKQTIYPDENYGREIMQLFSIGLFELNMDGTLKRKEGKRIPAYDQQDVMAVSRVFTGMTYPNHIFPNKKNPSLWISDALHPLICNDDFHDSEEKHFLGQTVPAGQSCFEDVQDTIDILVNHDNTAPFIARKLILRLTKSNPKTAYVQRVAEVFKTSGGDLGETVKAVLLDPEIWDDIQNDRATKIKEPYLTYVGMLKALDVKPWPKYTTTDDDGTKRSMENRYYVRSRYQYLNQWPTYSPSVFNFYSDDYEPNSDDFKIRGYKAPEAQLLTTKYMTGIENNTYYTLKQTEYHFLYASNGNKLGHSSGLWETYMLLDFKDYIEYFRRPGEEFKAGPRDAAGREEAVKKVIADASQRLLGKQLDNTFVQKLADSYKDVYQRYPGSWDNATIQKFIVASIIAPVITEIVMSEEYLTH